MEDIFAKDYIVFPIHDKWICNMSIFIIVRIEVVTRIRKHWLVVIVDRPNVALTALSNESDDEEEEGDSDSEDSNTSQSSDGVESEEENDDFIDVT